MNVNKYVYPIVLVAIFLGLIQVLMYMLKA